MTKLIVEGDRLELCGFEIASSIERGVSYRAGALLGEGGMSLAYFAQRRAGAGQCPVVLKLLRPSFVRAAGTHAELTVQKEAVALGRLNERVPPTPFVVRLIDTGALEVEHQAHGSYRSLALPWLAVEYVHGGPEGTTLSDRVAHSINATGFAFDAGRAAHAVDCLVKGVTAVHEVGVIHRDLKPDNVLCCGFGDEELFKVADFGVARPAGVAATFGGLLLGTPGYAPLELMGLDQRLIGSWTDVFSLACVVFHLLTGEEYFPINAIAQAIGKIRDSRRRSLLEAPGLSPELRAEPAVCRALDQALARATAPKVEDRAQTAAELGGSLLAWLRGESRRPRSAGRRVHSLFVQPPTEHPDCVVRHRGTDRHIRSVAWDGDGRCLAVSDRGLSFWNGTVWNDAPLHGLPRPEGIRFIRRMAAGKWLVGGDAGTFAIYTAEGVKEVVRGSDESVSFNHLSGDLDDLAVLVGTAAGEPPSLHAVVGRRWLKPLELTDVAEIHAVARMTDAGWLVAGRATTGLGFVGHYRPLDWELAPLASARGTFRATAAQRDRGLGIAVGAAGAAVWCDLGRKVTMVETVDERGDLTAAALDATGRAWAGGVGRLWTRGSEDGAWRCLWNDPAATVPVVSIFADVGLVMALCEDGAIIEWRPDGHESTARQGPSGTLISSDR